MFDKREDLMFCGRTLFGAMPPKGQEMDDHYFGAIKPRVAEFMADLNEELWKLGVLAKTEHNEVAPAQHELAPIYHHREHRHRPQPAHHGDNEEGRGAARPCLPAAREAVRRRERLRQAQQLVALRPTRASTFSSPAIRRTRTRGFCCSSAPLFRPWTIIRICSVSPLRRRATTTVSARTKRPPAVVSIFLGDELTAVLDAIENGHALTRGTEKIVMKLGAHVLPRFVRDTTDRNRTSPFAFTGNRV